MYIVTLCSVVTVLLMAVFSTPSSPRSLGWYATATTTTLTTPGTESTAMYTTTDVNTDYSFVADEVSTYLQDLFFSPSTSSTPPFDPNTENSLFSTEQVNWMLDRLLEMSAYDSITGDQKILLLKDMLTWNLTDSHMPRQDGFVYYPMGYDGKSDHPSVRMPDGTLLEVKHETSGEKAAIKQRALAGTLPPAINNFQSLGGKNKLSMSCSNQLCEMLLYQLTCKAQSLGFKKVCARYFLGFVYGCNIYPPSSEIYNAPSICLPEIAGLLQMLLGSATKKSNALQTTIANYLGNDFTHNACGRTCYQNFQIASNNFYYNCTGELTTYSKVYPIVTLMKSYQQFRNQACGQNSGLLNNTNCYSIAAKLMSSSSQASSPVPLTEVSESAGESVVGSTGAAVGAAVSASPSQRELQTAPKVDIMSMTCNWIPLYSNTAVNTMYAGPQICSKFNIMHCCAGSIFNIVQENQLAVLSSIDLSGGTPSINPNSLTFFPPCLLNYLSTACAVKVYSNITCSNGTIAAQTIVSMTTTITHKATGKYPLVNMYNKTSLLTFYSVLTNAFQKVGFTAVPLTVSPFQFMVTNYEYSDTLAVPPVTKKPSYNTSIYDYTTSNTVKCTFSMVFQNVNSSMEMKLLGMLRNSQVIGGLTQVLSGAYGQASFSPYIPTSSQPTTQAMPLDREKNDAGMSTSMLWRGSSVVAMVMMVTMSCAAVLMTSW